MKSIIIYLIVLFIIICFIVCGIYFFKSKNNNSVFKNQQIACITVKYELPGIFDVGDYEKYSIYKYRFNKYKYVKEYARETEGGMEDYEYKDTGIIASKKDLETLFNDIYSNEKVHDKEERKRKIEENDGKLPLSLLNEEYVHVFFEYDGRKIGEDTEGALSYEDIKEIYYRNFEQFKNLLFI